MFYNEDLGIEEDARTAGLEAFSASATDKAAPHIIQRFVNIYDHLATSLFNPKMLSALYPQDIVTPADQSKLTFAQKRFKEHVDKHGYMAMASCPVPSVVGLNASLLDYSIALANYTDFGTRVSLTLNSAYSLLAEVLNASDALSSVSTATRFVGIDTHLKYRARYNADLKRVVGEVKPTTEIPYGKLVRSNKEFLQTFDHRNSFERTLDEKLKNDIERTVNKIANLMNTVATDVTRDNADVNGRVISALSNLLFEIGQMTRDYGTYLYRINELIGVVDGVTSEVLRFNPNNVPAVAAGNNGLELAPFDAGLNEFNMSALGKLLIGGLAIIIGVVAGFLARGKRNADSSGSGSRAASAAKEFNEVMADKPNEKLRDTVARAPEVVKPAVEAVATNADTVKAADGSSVKVDEYNITKILARLGALWEAQHGVKSDPDAPKFNVREWMRNPIMPYEVRSKRMDLVMSCCLWYPSESNDVKALEKSYVDLANKFVVEVKNFKKQYSAFAADVERDKIADSYVSKYILEDSDAEVKALRLGTDEHYPTAGFDMDHAKIKARIARYSTDKSNHIDGNAIQDYMDAAFIARKNVHKDMTIANDELVSTQNIAKKVLYGIELAAKENAAKANEIMPHVRQLRKASLNLSAIASSLTLYYTSTASAESMVITAIEAFRDFGKTVGAMFEAVENEGKKK